MSKEHDYAHFAFDVCTRIPDKLAACFESVGHLCELGVVQSFCGTEPVGLFRFSSLPHDKLVELLETRLQTLDDPRGIDLITGPDEEWKVRIARFGMEFHTQRSIHDFSKKEFLPKMCRRTTFLKRKFLEQLQTADKIFLRRDTEASSKQLQKLHDVIRQYAGHRLLWVDHTEDVAQIGAAEWVQDGLLRSHYGYFWPNAAPTPPGLGVWLRILEAALRILHPHLWNDIVVSASLEKSAIDEQLPTLGWQSDHTTATLQEQRIEPVFRGTPVLKHVLGKDTSIDDGPIFFCETPKLDFDRIYVVSAWVWIPTEFSGWVGVTFPGMAWIRMWTVNPDQRNSWQRIVTSARADRELPRCAGLVVQARMGESFFSTGWRVERGCVPADCLYLPSDEQRSLI